MVEAATRWAAEPGEYIEKGMALRDEYRGDPLIATHFAPHAPYGIDDATLVRVRRLADELEIPVATAPARIRLGSRRRARRATASVRSPAWSSSASPARCSWQCT